MLLSKVEIGTIERLRDNRSDVNDAVEVLARAFGDSLGVSFISNYNPKVTKKIFLFLIKRGLSSGVVYICRDEEDKIQGVAVWASPPTYLEVFKCGWRSLFWTFVHEPKALINLFDCLSFCSRIEDEISPDPHMSLCYLGVSPKSRGRGMGTALMEKAMEEIDLPCYLELVGPLDEINSLERFYRKFGFEPASRQAYYKSELWHMAMVR